MTRCWRTARTASGCARSRVIRFALLVPGFEGNMNVKWLRRLHVTAEPAYSRDETSKYTDPMPNGTAREFTFYMEAKSIITRPSGGQRLSAPGFQEISGIAWTGRGKVRRVDVSVDDGKSWQEAQLQEPVLTRALTRFRLPWHWDGKPSVIQSSCHRRDRLRAADAGRTARGARR